MGDLAYNAEYEIKIRACGILPDSIDPVCGDWGAKKYQTGIGPSGIMPAPSVKFVNTTEVEVCDYLTIDEFWPKKLPPYSTPKISFHIEIGSKKLA